MDELRELSNLTLNPPSLFTNNTVAGYYTTVCIRATSDNKAVDFEAIGKKETELVELIDTPSPSKSSLTLIQINRRFGPDVEISQAPFSSLLKTMAVDPRVLYLISRDYDGFHYSRNEGDRFTGYIGMPAYVLIWTSHFNPTGTRTTALFCHKRRNPLPEFSMILRTFKNLVHSPYLLAYVSVIHMVHMFDRETNGEDLACLRDIEYKTGYGPSAQKCTKTLGIDDLSVWSQEVGELQVVFANKLRALRVSEALMQFISDECKLEEFNEGGGSKYLASKECTVKLDETLPFLRRQIDTLRDYMEYLKERAEKLSEVVFALMTHEDANISLRLVEEARRDSVSMKTIATMTMAFLPATFFAALFAVPSLQWDQSPVVQDSFWVYWACSIPATMAVFLIWSGIMHKNNILSLVRLVRGVRE